MKMRMMRKDCGKRVTGEERESGGLGVKSGGREERMKRDNGGENKNLKKRG